jgi:type III pantothenate kinase
MILDIDLGNTRIKWRSSDRPELVDSFHLGDEIPRQWRSISPSDRIRVASVLSAEKTTAFIEALQRVSNAPMQLARVQQGFAGLQLAYADISGFGVDRWLALLAARMRFPARDCVVVSGGTAVTVDWLTERGRHLGGYIAPGWRTAARALWQNADNLGEARRGLAPLFQPGTTTLECIAAGLTLFFKGFAAELHQAAAAEFPAPQWVFTGGDAETLMGFFAESGTGRALDTAQVLPSLVLEGLAVALP